MPYSTTRRSLTPRETDVMNLVLLGMNCRDIGDALGISFRTVEVIRQSAKEKLGAKTIAQAAVVYYKSQLVMRGYKPESLEIGVAGAS